MKRILPSRVDRTILQTSSSILRRHNPRRFMELSRGQVRWHGDDNVPDSAKTIPLTFIRRNGEKKTVMAAPGQNILRIAQQNDIELEGACECSVACSTCHVILEPRIYQNLAEASEDEEDMLDMAFGLTSTSRLGCQVKVDESMKNAIITLPKATRNFYVDGHQPKPH